MPLALVCPGHRMLPSVPWVQSDSSSDVLAADGFGQPAGSSLALHGAWRVGAAQQVLVEWTIQAASPWSLAVNTRGCSPVQRSGHRQACREGPGRGSVQLWIETRCEAVGKVMASESPPGLTPTAATALLGDRAASLTSLGLVSSPPAWE